jgi:hypothetical protein
LRETPDGLISGGLTNAGSAPLADAVLLFERWAWPLGTLRPRETVQIDRLFSPRTIDTLLTQRKTVGDKDQITPYDRGGGDAGRILQMMMFYQAAGGRRYTGLSNGYVRFLDLSGHLRMGQAILMARGPAAGTWLLDGQAAADDEPTTYYRFVMPVNRRTTVELQRPGEP